MKLILFRVLSRFNRLFPSLSREELTSLGKGKKLLLAWRYWVTMNRLELENPVGKYLSEQKSG